MPPGFGRRSGFTTTEIVVVAAIALVLIGIVIAIFGKVRSLVQSWS